MANQHNPGEQDPSTQAGTRSHQNPGGQPQAKPIEEKHLADPAEGRPEPSANPERAPQHTPGFEAKQQKEAEKSAGKPADKSADKSADEHKPRTHLARAKQHVKRMAPRRHK